MRASADTSLIEASEAMERLLEAFEKFKLTEKVDIGARLRSIIKNANDLDEKIKDDIKAHRHGKEGTVMGDNFKAILSVVPQSRFDAKALKEEDPKTYALYEVDSTQKRVNYEPR